jgi:negative regulator of flagellin synthesis FlgM
MIISGKQVQSVLKIYADQNMNLKTRTERTEFKSLQSQDEVILSSGVQEFGQILQALKDVPDVRKEKVQKLSAQVEDGTYNVDADEIANKMISRLLVDNLR